MLTTNTNVRTMYVVTWPLYSGWFVPCRISVFSGRKCENAMRCVFGYCLSYLCLAGRKVAMRKLAKITIWQVFAWRPFAFSPRKLDYTTWHKSATIGLLVWNKLCFVCLVSSCLVLTCLVYSNKSSQIFNYFFRFITL